MFVSLLIVMCILAAIRFRRRSPPPPPSMDLAGAHRAVARLKEQIARTQAEWSATTRPLKQILGAHEQTIKQLRRAVAAKKRENSELCQTLWGEGSMYIDNIDKAWNSIARTLHTQEEYFLLCEMMMYAKELEDTLLRKKPHLRHSVECMRSSIARQFVHWSRGDDV